MGMTPGARAAWSRWWADWLAWGLWALTLLGLAAALWLDWLLRRAGRSELAIRTHELPYLLAMVGMATVGVLLARRRPRHPVRSTAASTGAATTPPAPSRRSAPGCASRSTWTR
jgi:hypothetical protein